MLLCSVYHRITASCKWVGSGRVGSLVNRKIRWRVWVQAPFSKCMIEKLSEVEMLTGFYFYDFFV